MQNNFKRKPKRKLTSEMNVVPYIDVMLVLLVIFMVTAPLLNQGVQVNLPKTNAVQLPQTNNTIATITITSNQNYYINFSNEVVTRHSKSSQNASTLEDVISHINSRNSSEKLQIFIRADENVPYASAVKLIANLQQTGIEQVGLVTEEP